MTKRPSTESLIEEVSRYLAAVDAFRAAGCEPTWLPEGTRPLPASLPVPPLPSSVPLDLGLH